MNFRKDINGLRAIAVIAVVLFHFNSTWMPGGFAGVDVFFVISGFLMTGIIARGIDRGNFSILSFYAARANRIIPALAALCFSVGIFGWFYLTPLDYKSLGEHITGSMGFTSNITYWEESGYFDASSLEKWLLHTWSLSVEWQFYILYPLILVAAHKFISSKAIKPVVLIGAALSFIACVFVTYRWPVSAYYMLPTRAWEMMIGGVAYLFPLVIPESRKKIVELAGVILIVGACLAISAATPWPGYIALFPVLGSFLIIQAQRSNSLLTGNVVFQKIGEWSYSIYLWHWPLVVAIYYFSLGDEFIYIGIITSVLLGAFSHKYIEKINFSKNTTTLKNLWKLKPIYLSLALILMGNYIAKNGVDTRFTLTPEANAIKAQLVMPLRSNGYCFYSLSRKDMSKVGEAGVNCKLGATDQKPTTLLFGDSYAGHNEPFFDEIFKSKKASFQSIVTNYCTPSLTDRYVGSLKSPAYKQCLFNRRYLKNNMQNYKNIIFSGSWNRALAKGQIEDVAAVINMASESGINVFIMAAPYAYKSNPLNAFYKSIYFNTPLDMSELRGDDGITNEANAYLKSISKKYKNVHFIDRELLYDSSHTFEFDGMTIPYYLDGEHLSLLGSKNSAKHFMQHPDYNKIMHYFDL